MFEEEEERKEKTVVDYIIEYFWIWVPLLVMIFLKGRLGEVGPYDKAVFGSFCFMVFALITKGAYNAFLNATPKIVYNNGWATTDGTFETKGNYAIIRPAIKAFQWYYKFKSPVFICPIDAITKIGDNLILNVDMEKVSISELPIEVRSYIVEKGLKPPYYMGLASPEQFLETLEVEDKELGISKPKVTYLVEELKERNKMIALLENLLRGKFETLEEFVAASQRIHERARGGFIESVVRALKEKGEKE